MRAGQKKYASDGTQVCLFPLETMQITQVSSPSSYSHCCGHPVDYGMSESHFPIYAPFDCHLYKRGTTRANSRFYVSDSPVLTPSGVSYVSIQITHDNNPPAQESFLQGDLIGHSGTAGQVTGDHTHIDQSLEANDPWVGYGIKCYGVKFECWALQDSTDAYNVFYIDDTDIINDAGLPWKIFGESEPIFKLIVEGGLPMEAGDKEGATIELKVDPEKIPKDYSFWRWEVVSGEGQLIGDVSRETIQYKFGKSDGKVRVLYKYTPKSMSIIFYTAPAFYRKC